MPRSHSRLRSPIREGLLPTLRCDEDHRRCRDITKPMRAIAAPSIWWKKHWRVVVKRWCARAIMRRFSCPLSTDGFARQRIDRFRPRPGHGMNASPLFGQGSGAGARANDQQGLLLNAIIGSSNNRHDPIGRRVRGPTHFFRLSSGEFGE